MARHDEMVALVLAVQNLSKFYADTQKAAKGVKDVGDEAEQTGKKAGFSWKSLAKWGGIATAAYGAARFLKSAGAATEDLGRQTLALHRTTQMDIKTSSEWASVLKSRGMNTAQFQRGLVQLSKQIEKTRLGTKKHNSALEQLGLTSYDTSIRTGNVEQVLLKVSDALAKTQNPATKATLAQQLLGRQAQQLAPLLYKGSDAIREQLGIADKYGDTIGGKTVKGIQEAIQHQRELAIATDGLKVQMGTALLPVMLQFTHALVLVMQAIQPVVKNSWLLWTVIGVLTTAYVTYTAATIAATVAETLFGAAAAATAAIITGGIVLAIIALIAVTIILIKHWGTVKKVSRDVWGWIKKNWPLLVGILVAPWLVFAVEVVKHFGLIKKAAKALVTFVIRQFERLVSWMHRMGPKLLGSVGNRLLHLAEHPSSVLGFGKRAIGLQHGGTLTSPGTVIVGEAGPEALTLPAGAQVTPLGPSGVGSAGPGDLRVTVPLYLNNRVIAQAVADFTSDQLARR